MRRRLAFLIVAAPFAGVIVYAVQHRDAGTAILTAAAAIVAVLAVWEVAR